MKLVKLTDDHYVVVTDEPIEWRDYFLNTIQKKVYCHDIENYDVNKHYLKKITHSTQPLEEKQQAPTYTDNAVFINFNSQKVYDKVKQLSLQEVKELIGEVDKTEWEVEWETIDNREPCDCSCHNNPNMIHFVACCNDGWIGKVTQKLKLK